MNAQKEYFIYLVSCFLNGETPIGRETDFEKLYELSDIHDVSAIVAGELKKVDIKPEGKIKSYFTQCLGYAVQEYEVKTKSLGFIDDFLSSNAFDHIFVKGIILRELYPVKELRTSGDIDVIVRECDFEKIVNLIKSNEINVIRHTSDTLIIKKYETEIEIHKFADVNNSYFDNIFAIANKNGYRYELSDYDHLLFVICHIAKHLSYRGAGIRMICDIDVLIRSIDNFNQNYFDSLCNKSGIEKTAQTLLSLSNLWFKTPIKPYVSFEKEKNLLELLENVFINGGSFGYETSSIPASYYENTNSKLKVFLKLAFPSREYLKLSYPYYNKNSLLLPIARINRLTDGLFKKRTTAKGAVKELKNGNKNNYLSLLIEELNIKG